MSRAVESPWSVTDTLKQADLEDPEVLRDLAQRRLGLAGHGDDVGTELGRKRLRHRLILPARTNPHRSGVNRTGGSPEVVCLSVVDRAAMRRAHASTQSNGAEFYCGSAGHIYGNLSGAGLVGGDVWVGRSVRDVLASWSELIEA
jgi:hypothetical protein